MSTQKFIEYHGNIYTFSEDYNIDEMWSIIKHEDIPNIKQLVKIATAAKKYNCIYNNDIMEKIKMLF